MHPNGPIWWTKRVQTCSMSHASNSILSQCHVSQRFDEGEGYLKKLFYFYWEPDESWTLISPHSLSQDWSKNRGFKTENNSGSLWKMQAHLALLASVTQNR